MSLPRAINTETTNKTSLEHYQEAFAHFINNELNEAIVCYTRALDAHDGTLSDDLKVRAYNNRGNAFMGMDRANLALADYQNALRLDPTMTTLYFNRANAHHSLKHYHKAIRDYGYVIQLDAANHRAYYERASLYYFRNVNYLSAINDICTAIRLSNSSPQYRFLRAVVYDDYYTDDNRHKVFLGQALIDMNQAMRGQCPRATEMLGSMLYNRSFKRVITAISSSDKNEAILFFENVIDRNDPLHEIFSNRYEKKHPNWLTEICYAKSNLDRKPLFLFFDTPANNLPGKHANTIKDHDHIYTL